MPIDDGLPEEPPVDPVGPPVEEDPPIIPTTILEEEE